MVEGWAGREVVGWERGEVRVRRRAEQDQTGATWVAEMDGWICLDTHSTLQASSE